VVQSSNNRIIIPINEPTDDKSQIQEYVNRHRGPGVQHVAMGTADIMDTLPKLQSQGFNFLRTPDTYYELLPGRIARGGYAVTESLDRAKQLGIQIDGDTTGYLLQIFTEDQIGPLFFEVIQRRAIAASEKAISRRCSIPSSWIRNGAAYYKNSRGVFMQLQPALHILKSARHSSLI